jgi:CubicO group peptidase (beta-lactamase class C family)
MRMGKATTVALLAGLQVLVASVATAGGPDAETVWPAKTWAVSTAEAQGMDSGRLAQLVDTVGERKQDSLLIVRHGKIVVEAYYAPYASGIPHDLRSVTKSITGTLTAIEIQQGLLDSVDHKILDLFADSQIANIDDNKRALTVQSLLDMTSGIAWVEKAYTPDETLFEMYRSPNPTQFVLDRPMSGVPGTQFYYNGGNPYLLSALINRKTGHGAARFAKDMLFGPLGITSARWGKPDAQGVTDGEAGLFLTPEDMARIGYLYLRKGNWEGRQMIPESWIERVRAGPVPATFGYHYADLWWSLPEKGAYFASGLHSQLILVLPALDVVAVLTGFMSAGEYYPYAQLVDDISSTVRSDTPLPPDPIARALLAASLRNAATERPSPVASIPDLAGEFSGKAYRFDANSLEVTTLSLQLTGPNASFEITTQERGSAPEKFTGLIGLQGMFAKSPASYGINAVKGRWLNAHMFAMERRILGHGEMQHWTLTFTDKAVDVHFESTDGLKVDLHGEAKH